MSKRDFEAIAHTLNANMAPLELVLDFADMLEETNPRFDRSLFVQAATMTIRVQMQRNTKALDFELKGN